MNTRQYLPDAGRITSFLRLLFQPGDVFEIRVLDAERPGYRRPHIESGYFDYEHIEAVPAALADITAARGTFVTPNPVNPALLARAANRIRPVGQEPTTSDGDIVARRWLLLDFDAVRPAGISATDAEHQAALTRAAEVRDRLVSLGWPEAISVDSGNGGQALCRIDLPADDGGLVQRCLQALATSVDDARVHLDQAVHNPARIWRLPGTWNRKGDDLPDRPHRMAVVLSAPDASQAAARALLEAMAQPDAPAAGMPQGAPVTPTCAGSGDRPGDEYNRRGEIGPVLEAAGWQHVGEANGNQLWRRPGKDTGTHSATFDGRTFYVFSSNAAPFEANRGYSPFAVFALLKHGGDFTAASAALAGQGYGAGVPADGVDISWITAKCGPPRSGDAGGPGAAVSGVTGAGSQPASALTPDAPAPAAGVTDPDAETAKVLAAFQPRTLIERLAEGCSLNPPVIHGVLREGETMNIIASPKVGKALAVDTPILTDRGWLTMGQVEPGMAVHAGDGTLTEVVAVSEVMCGRPCYRISTRSGCSVVADENHLWSVHQRRHAQVVTTGDLARGRHGRRWLIPVAGRLQRPRLDLPLDPWMLGYWLGNGHCREAELTINAADYPWVRRRIEAAGFMVGNERLKPGAVQVRVHGLQIVLRAMGLLSNKHIPAAYTLAGADQRQALLAGLLDSDGHAGTAPNGSGSVEFCTTDGGLALQVFGLARSLGFKAAFHVGRARLNGIDCSGKMRVTFVASRADSPFSPGRKTDALPARPAAARCRGDAITAVQPVPSVPVRCIQVAHPSGTFLAGEAFMVTHNSWLASSLAISVASGLDWLGFPVEQGGVLHIDNELHANTAAHRYQRLADALGLEPELFAHNLTMVSLRGRLTDINRLGALFAVYPPGTFRLVIIDAFYRAMPKGTDENDNGTIAELYNLIDLYAMHMGCAIVLIHHTSKGVQAGKTVTDVGAGAGSQSRAVDTHMVLRQHEEQNLVVLEAAARSWPPISPIALEWNWPLFTPAAEVDTSALLGAEKPAAPRKSGPSLEEFVETCVARQEPCSLRAAVYEAQQAFGLRRQAAEDMLALALEKGLVEKIKAAGAHMKYVSAREDVTGDKAKWIAALVAKDPCLDNAGIARMAGVSERYVRQVRHQLEGGLNTQEQE